MQTVVAHSIDAFGRDEWNRLFPGEIEDWSFYRAIERAQLAGFRWLYFAVRDGGELVAAVPAFVTDYRLDTTLTGALRRFCAAVSRRFPRFLRVGLLCLGSPVGEVCHLGVAAGASAERRDAGVSRLFDAIEQHAARERIPLLASKDAAAGDDALWREIGGAHGLRRQPSLPTATLDIAFDSLDGYFATLGRATRRDLRRKLKASSALRVEWRTNIDDIVDDITRLYRATLANAQYSFEELTPEFFRGVLREMPGRALCATYWLGDRLVAFNLVLHDETTLLDKFLGMDYSVARELNLYYATWLSNVAWCIEHGVRRYQAGQGLHREKLRLGCRLAPNSIWYRHRNRVLDVVFAAFERWFRLDRGDSTLAALDPAPEPVPDARRRPPLAAWSGFLACAALSQVAFKLAAQQTGPVAASAQWLVAAFASPWLWVSVASHVGEFLLWMTILSKSTLSSAFASSAVLFVVVLAASWAVFGEPVGWSKLAGCAAILLGLLLLGADDDAEPAAGGRGT